MWSLLQRHGSGINGKRTLSFQPFFRVNKATGCPALIRLQKACAVCLPLPVNVDLQVHKIFRERRIRLGTLRSSKLSASASVAGAAKVASRS